LTATFSSLPTPRYSTGIWTNASEVSKLPISGLSWDNMKLEADIPLGTPNLSDNEDTVGVAVLAKALVYVRTGDQTYRQAVITACMAAIGTELDGDALAFGRELLAYVLAADLVGLPPIEDTAFRNWLRGALSQDLKGQNLRTAQETRPNNWGTRCGAARAAIARYLGDATELERTARVFKGWLGDRNIYADFSYDNDPSWQANPAAPVGINPLGATIQGHSVDGVLPEDQRRSGAFTWPPPKENYVYGALQGALMEAIILYRAGYDVWNWENQALLRAVKWLYQVADYPADGDDEWLIHITNYFYKTNFLAPFPARPGKNAGWTDWLYGSKYSLTVSDNNGDIAIHALGAIKDSLVVMKLQAIPSANYLFNGWSGDLSGMKNPDTLIMNANKNVVANFVKTGPFTVTVTTVGSGTVALNPPGSEALPGGTYYGGTVVTLTANPSPGFKFIGWSGDLSGTANPESLIITNNKNITATFKAAHTLTVNVIGSGSVTLDPPSGPYEDGTVVTLTAKPVTGYQFIEWSGDLTDVTNPATVTMNADKSVTATFTRVRVVHEGTKTGGSSLSAIVTTAASFIAAKNHLYLAAITTRPNARVNSVSGLGLAWKFVKAQCSGRNTIGVELWMAQGTSISNGVVTATLASAPYNAVLAVSSYSGAAITNAIGNVISGNSTGFNGACSSGVDSNAYSFDLMTTMNGAVVFGIAGMRNKTHAPGIGYAERVELKQGISSNTAAIAIEDKTVPAVGTAVVSGTFSGAVDWAVIAVEIKPPVVLPSEFFEDHDTTAKAMLPADYQLYQNYPNPFNAQTQIEYYLPEAPPGGVNLSIYNLYGQKVRTLVDELQAAGRQQVLWTGTDDLDQPVGSGVYLLRLEGSGQHVTRRILLVK
jgi:hypothetical protein